MTTSKSKIDRAGQAFAKNKFSTEEELIELDNIFDNYRKAHLQPLTDCTLELQEWLTEYDTKYYIAQRLKRKPQIIRKLKRLSVRLTQLQDIGGCRIIVNDDQDVDRLHKFLEEKMLKDACFKITHTTDYRPRGRDDSGYRALHLLLKHSGFTLELQIRSQVQHYWAESIERTSVIYGYHLKEQEGDKQVIAYFKSLSDVFFEIESGREPNPRQKIEIDALRESAEQIIVASDKNRVFDSYVNEDIIKTLAEVQSRRKGFNNWIIVFDWKSGSFVSWEIVDRNPDAASAKYVESERFFPAHDGFEVVMIGSSDIATVRQTHSHYFGIASYDGILENLERSLVGFNRRMDIDTGARQILLALRNKSFWGKKKVCSIPTLRNHYCQTVLGFDSSLRVLVDKELVLVDGANGPVSLNLAKTKEINHYLGIVSAATKTYTAHQRAART